MFRTPDLLREAREQSIDTTDDGEDCIEALIYYLYNLDYPDSTSPLALHVRMAILADKYDIRDLGVIAYVKLAEALRKESSRTMTSSMRLEQHGMWTRQHRANGQR